MLKQTRITKINNAIEQNVEPHRSRNDSLLLRLGEKSFVRLQNGDKLTPAGRHYYQQTNKEPPTQLDGTLVQRGASEYLVRGGKAKVLRRFQNNDYVYTALGKKYFESHKTTFLVHVPARIKKRDSKSQGLSFMVPHNAFMGDLEVPSNVPLAEQKIKLKEKVLAHIDKLDKVDGQPILYEDSDPVVYDDDGEWT